jgi:hypothetical protein
MTAQGANQNEREEYVILYIMRLFVNSQAAIRFLWKDVFIFLESTFSIGRDKVKEILEKNGFSHKINDDDEFQIYGIFSAIVPEDVGSQIYTKVIEELEIKQPIKDLILSLSLNYGFTKAAISVLTSRSTRLGKQLRLSPLFAICSSDMFLESTEFNQYSRKVISSIKVRPEDFYSLLRKKWFVDIMEVLEAGYYGTETISIMNRIQELWADEDLEGLEKLISSGIFIRIFSNRSLILLDPEVNRSLSYKGKQERRNRNLKVFYHWLGIANDFSLGLEFLVGSFEFLPNMNEIFGVYLFIAGSVQLTARAIISIVSDAHLSARQRKIMKNL